MSCLGLRRFAFLYFSKKTSTSTKKRESVRKMPSSCSDNHEKSLCVTRGVERRQVWSSRTCYPLWKVQQSFVTRRNEWKKHDEKKLISVFDSRKSFSLNLKRDSKKIASIIFLSGLRLLWYMQCSQSYYSHTQKDHRVLCAFHQLSTLHLCGKIRILYDTVKVRLLVTLPSCPLIGCFKFCHAWPPASYQLPLESATLEEISPERLEASASGQPRENMLLVQNKSIWEREALNQERWHCCPISPGSICVALV